MASSNRRSICSVVCRRKEFKPEHLEGGALKRCLNRWDLTALGVGSTLGAGVYVLIGYVALNIAGPSIVLSFLIAAVAALCAGLCYAEFGARVPRAGSAYIYTYVAINELTAFFIGWCNILEAAVGTASLARGLSMYVDLMSNNTMSTWMTSVMPLPSSYIAPYFDLFACALVLVIGTSLAFGMRGSATVNNVLSVLNVAVVLFIIITGSFTANPENWFILSSDVPEGSGSGGFFPFGVSGTLRGAALCFYGFVGFDSINAAAEEVRIPTRAIPYTILIVLMIAFLLYTGIAIVVTMMVPYYLQNSIDALGAAFVFVGWDWAKWFVYVGAICGILSSLFGALMPLPRLLYAMSSNGMSFGCFSKVTAKTSTPLFATVSSAIIIAGVAGLFDLEQLITTMCLGTLISYTIVSISVIVLRYRSRYAPKSSPGFFKELFGCGFRLATKGTGRIVDVSLFIFICICVSSALVITQLASPLIPALILQVAALFMVIIMALQPKALEEVFFKTPLVPLIPCLSIYVNVHLMVLIKVQTWLCVGIWMLIGIPIYILTVFCCESKDDIAHDSETVTSYTNKNGKPPVQIIVESPTPPGTTTNQFSNYVGNRSIQEVEDEIEEENSVRLEPIKTEGITIHQAYVENNEEKEAKIIDLLDQVLQAEEDTYGEVISLKDQKEEEIVPAVHESEAHRKSVSELSDAGSDASLGNQALSKYDVIAQVHREDLPKVTEEEERRDDEDITEQEIENYEQITAFNDSETNSRTDESGYSDTFDRTLLPDALDDKEDAPIIPVPPPLDENYFRSPNFKKSYTISSRPTKTEKEDEEENKPRESIQSNSSQSDDNITFGSDRQINFMSKLNNIFQNKITSNSDDEEPRKRSHSTGNVTENTEFSVSRDRPSLFLDLQKEILSREAAQNLRPINADDNKSTDEELVEDTSLSREDLKSKLENIFASGGPRLLKPRLMKSNPPTPEEAYQTDTSSTESISKLPKMEKNDTLNRQKAKFGEVLNSFRLSFNKDDAV